ncbi:PrsW family intramembrane metalloprotease [Virgibacillus byunsanensis]|uniref:PrsW family intramembrane metalloprotease n=1 Tax=Virgibacillus byunsanensis TaxID=570945 RepID=A0ABW3LH91_9BACI
MFCYNCGVQTDYDRVKFCSSCGVLLEGEGRQQGHYEENNKESSATVEEPVKDISQQAKGTFLQATERINAMVGEQGNIDLNLRDVFSSVFKKHTKEEGETLFIAGTVMTTPAESEISTSWPKPWLFSRVFIVLAITYILLSISTYTFHNMNALPGVLMVGSFAVPISLLIFFWEMNAPRNISVYEIAKMFFIGGASSLVITLLLYTMFPVYDLNYTGAVIVGIVEEVGKLVIIAYFIKKLNTKFILNGLLIGATIGAGFAAFESAGYAFNFREVYGDEAMISIIFLRAWSSIGTHVVWSAIAGAALVYVKGERPLQGDHFFDSKFVKLFLVAVVLHAVWDMPIYLLQHFYLQYIILIVIAWIFIFTLVNAGLKQIMRLSE